MAATPSNALMSFGVFKQNNHDRWKRNHKLYNNIRVAESYKGILKYLLFRGIQHH